MKSAYERALEKPAADPAKRLEEEENYRVQLRRLAERLESEVRCIRRG